MPARGGPCEARLVVSHQTADPKSVCRTGKITGRRGLPDPDCWSCSCFCAIALRLHFWLSKPSACKRPLHPCRRALAGPKRRLTARGGAARPRCPMAESSTRSRCGGASGWPCQSMHFCAHACLLPAALSRPPRMRGDWATGAALTCLCCPVVAPLRPWTPAHAHAAPTSPMPLARSGVCLTLAAGRRSGDPLC